jgi:hypothetical protein
MSLPLPVETVAEEATEEATEEDDAFESAAEDLSFEPSTAQILTGEDLTVVPVPANDAVDESQEYLDTSLDTEQSMEALAEPGPAEDLPFMKHSGAASIVYGPPKRNSQLLKSLFSMSPGVEMKSSTINILNGSTTVHEAASDDEHYHSTRSSVESNFNPPVEFVVQLPSHFEPVPTKLVRRIRGVDWHLTVRSATNRQTPCSP